MLVTHVGRNGVRNRLVQQAVEGVKLIYGNRRIHFLGELGDRLAEISVVVDHLLHAVSEPEQLAAVQAGGPPRLDRAGRLQRVAENGVFRRRRRGLLADQRLEQLVKDKRHAVLQLGRGCGRRGPLRNLQPAAVDQILPVRAQQLGKHPNRLAAATMQICTPPYIDAIWMALMCVTGPSRDGVVRWRTKGRIRGAWSRGAAIPALIPGSTTFSPRCPSPITSASPYSWSAFRCLSAWRCTRPPSPRDSCTSLRTASSRCSRSSSPAPPPRSRSPATRGWWASRFSWGARARRAAPWSRAPAKATACAAQA